jgi:glucokinase
MQQPEVIGIDIGGTAIKLGRFLQDGSCSESLTIATPQPATPEAVVGAIAAAVASLKAKGNCTAIGVGMPGPADASGRIARIAINLPGWQEVPLADWLEAKTGLPAIVGNDANCAGMGERWLGAGRRFEDFILLTLGTGVGGAIFLNGKLFTGRIGAAGDLGLIALNFDGHPCNSGNQGSLEQYASAQAIRRETGREPAAWGKLAGEGNPEALAFWEEYGRRLAAGLASLIYVLTPEAILIGGGISASSEFFLPATWKEIERRVQPSAREGLQLLKAELGNRAGMLGAAKLAWEMVFGF